MRISLRGKPGAARQQVRRRRAFTDWSSGAPAPRRASPTSKARLRLGGFARRRDRIGVTRRGAIRACWPRTPPGSAPSSKTHPPMPRPLTRRRRHARPISEPATLRSRRCARRLSFVARRRCIPHVPLVRCGRTRGGGEAKAGPGPRGLVHNEIRESRRSARPSSSGRSSQFRIVVNLRTYGGNRASPSSGRLPSALDVSKRGRARRLR